MASLRILLSAIAMSAAFLTVPQALSASDYVVYSVFKPLDLGNPDEPTQKDFYVNMGSNQGLREGSQLEVVRRISTYDLLNQKLYQDVNFPIARIKVIHVENNAAICRLEKMLPQDKTPGSSVRAVMVGDVVRRPE